MCPTCLASAVLLRRVGSEPERHPDLESVVENP
jgi:hypothetical protein